MNEIGSLSVGSRNPMIIQISNCTVCGQLNGTGEMFECAFHEGFFQGALSARLGKPVKVSQETNYAGDAGTWCRRLAVDVPWPPRWLRQIGQRRRYPKAVAE